MLRGDSQPDRFCQGAGSFGIVRRSIPVGVVIGQRAIINGAFHESGAVLIRFIHKINIIKIILAINTIMLYIDIIDTMIETGRYGNDDYSRNTRRTKETV